MSFILNVIMLLMSGVAAYFMVKYSSILSNSKIKIPFLLLMIFPAIKMTFFSKSSLESIGFFVSNNTELYFQLGFGGVTMITGFYVLYSILGLLSTKSSKA
jgi:hypothetical protein